MYKNNLIYINFYLASFKYKEKFYVKQEKSIF